ncbi:M23 family metallopeptidase [Lysinibacillus fusiformis]|nr:M23 family metallopeptidase [Lysinibacillus fusiformis]
MMKPKDLSDVLLSGNFEKVYKQMSEYFQNEVSFKQFQELGEKFNKDITKLILQSELPYDNGAKQYVWTDDSGTKGMIAVFDEDDVIQVLQLIPLAVYHETDEIFTKTKFHLPFRDEWFVFWGGTNKLVNYHYEYENQRYAYDFAIVNENRSYEGDPSLNESYFAFGKEYLAPADGVVVSMENNVEDNEPVGTFNEEQPFGNYVIVDHGNEEFSYLVHFKHQSIVVKQGDKIKQGDLLGLVGNSGNSSEPHIHFHVADSPDPMNSKSIRINFNGKRDHIQGDFVK